jgi:hypothetical protein
MVLMAPRKRTGKSKAPAAIDEQHRKLARYLGSLCIGGLFYFAGTLMGDISAGSWWFMGALFLCAAALYAWGNRIRGASGMLIVAVLAAGPLAYQGWRKATMADQKLQYRICGIPRQDMLNGRLNSFEMDIELINDNPAPKAALIEADPILEFADVPGKRVPPDRPLPLGRKSEYILSTGVDYYDVTPPDVLGKQIWGRYRYVINYGRDEQHMTKPLVVSGRMFAFFGTVPGEFSEVEFIPDTPSSKYDLVGKCSVVENRRMSRQ